MLKRILAKIDSYEKQRQIKINKQNNLQKELDNIDIKLKKLYVLKKDYEKLEKNFVNLLEETQNKD